MATTADIIPGVDWQPLLYIQNDIIRHALLQGWPNLLYVWAVNRKTQVTKSCKHKNLKTQIYLQSTLLCSGVQTSGDAQGNFLIVCPLTKF